MTVAKLPASVQLFRVQRAAPPPPAVISQAQPPMSCIRASTELLVRVQLFRVTPYAPPPCITKGSRLSATRWLPVITQLETTGLPEKQATPPPQKSMENPLVKVKPERLASFVKYTHRTE